ncbi:MAG: helix-turn-helix transcriptional regulator [Alphaproteobacteria bacterium]|nr:helix-turn-helix transcriptional regulator [Alphaproteobacteria bacterium]
MEIYNYIIPSPEDIKGARAYLGLSQAELAEKVGISKKSLISIEKRATSPSRVILEKILHVFIAEGIVFHQEGGFKANQSLFRALEGKEGIKEFYDEIINFARSNEKCEVLSSGISEEEFETKMTEYDLLNYYISNMSEIDGITLKVFTTEEFAPEEYEENYIEAKAIPREMFTPFPTYVYEDKVGIILFHADKAFIIHDKELADNYKNNYNMQWNSSYAKSIKKKTERV